MTLALDAGTRGEAASADLAVTGLAMSFGGARPVFSGLDFAVARGEALALVGANGAGKSTLLRCCLGLVAPDAGAVRLLGEDILALGAARRRALRRHTGLVAQRHNLVPRLSVLSNVIHGLLGQAGGPRFWSHAAAPEEARTRAMAALDRVGIADLALRRADRLSGGQSQRAAIARALVSEPRLLIADEPCASLDPAAGEEIMALFFRLVRETGVTVIFTSHQIDHALTYGDRVLGLKAGGFAIDARAEALAPADFRMLYD
ncbi:MAG: ATP-binding cassette domain-containing protein [Paracoccaceae bacterium]|nr:ATP-binding cassette domain-containing protein [Paracoccaceae bacterium]